MACHPRYTMQGIQNLWELPEETSSQTSSKKIGTFPHATYTNGWGRRKKSEKTPFYPAFNLSYNFASCVEIIFTKTTTCPLSQRSAISLIGPVLPPGLAGVGGTVSQQMQPRCWDLSQKPRHVIFLEATAFIFSTDGQHSLKLYTNGQGQGIAFHWAFGQFIPYFKKRGEETQKKGIGELLGFWYGFFMEQLWIPKCC